MGGGQWVLHPQKPVLRARPADLEGELISNIPAVSSRSSGSFTAARAAQRRSMPALAGTMLPLDPKVKPNPLQKANVCSCLFFWWLNPLFKIGHKRKLEEDDMYSVLPEDRSQHLGEELQGYWDQEVSRAQKDAREPSLTKAILKCYGKSYLVLGMLTFLEEGTRVVLPVFLGKMVSYVENYDPTDSAALRGAYGCAAGLSACVLVWAVLHHLYFYHMQRVGMRLRVAMCHMIYRKGFQMMVQC